MKITNIRTLHIELTSDEAKDLDLMLEEDFVIYGLFAALVNRGKQTVSYDHARQLKEFLQNRRESWSHMQCELAKRLFDALPSFDELYCDR